MIKYLYKFNILDNAQHGFKSGRSTETAAISFVYYECIDNGLYVAGFFLTSREHSIAFTFNL